MPLQAVHAVLFALVYFGAAEIGYMLSLGPEVGGTFWPPAGIALAVFLVAPRRAWPALVAAGLAANYVSDFLHGQTLLASVGFAAVNLGEPLVGAFVLQRLLSGTPRFTRVTDMLALAAVVLLVSAPLGAAVGALTAQWQTPNPPGFLQGWRTWWVGDAVGALVLTPPAVRFMGGFRRIRGLAPRTWLEVGLFGVVVVAVTQFVFTGPSESLALPFLVFPVLIWGSLRLGVVGVGAALVIIVVLTAQDTAAGQGPFAAEHLSFGDRLVALQIYVGVMAVSFHALALLWEERTRASAALRVAHAGLEARFKPIVEQSPFAIAAVDTAGAVRELNTAWRRLWGEARGAQPDVAAASSWRTPDVAPLLARAFSGEIVELPTREASVEGEGETRHVRGFAYPVKDEHGRVFEVVIVDRDITDELSAQQQLLEANRNLREREEALSQVLAQMAEAQTHREELLEAERVARGEAERASQLKDEFLATLSHELRTPLNAIVGWAHILQRGQNEQTVAQAVETIERNARAQAKLIDDLLDMSRIMAGKMGLTFARVRVSDVVTAAADALRPTAEAKSVTLAVDVGAAEQACVSADAARLQQVVGNLLGNAVKFTPAGGRVDVVLERRGSDARLVVRDTGQGIAREFLPAVFERFRQADGTITRRHGGLGLGLSIAKHIVEMHGGTIEAASEGPGRGATFAVTLPLAAGDAADDAAVHDAAAHDAGQAVSLAGLRVLVVDDEADARELLRRLLDEHGCDVRLASSAAEALASLGREACDVLLTDIGMPGTDGYDLMRRVRAGRYSQPRSIAVTAFARPEDRDRAIAAGFDAHLAKPINAMRLVQLVRQLAIAARADKAR